MQLCQYCIDFGTCKRPKYLNDVVADPCDAFQRIEGLSQDDYESIKAVVRQAISQAKAAKQDKVVYNLDAPLEISSRDSVYPHPDAWVQLLNTDLDDDAVYDAFHATHIEPYFAPQITNMPDLREELQTAQTMLIDIFNGRVSVDAFKTWNFYLSSVELAIYIDEEGFKTRTRFAGPLPGAMSESIASVGLFCVQAAEYVSKMQEPKRCPVCRDYFVPANRRGPKARTCPKGTCKIAMSRHREKYLKRGAK